MHPTAGAIVDALRSRVTLGCAAVAAVVAVSGGALPLLDVPGLELGMAGAVLSALAFAPALGITAARRELARAGPWVSVLRPFAASSVAASGMMTVLFAASALRAAIATPCRPMAGAAVFALVAVPAALLACAVAVAATVVARGRRWRATLLHEGVVLASLAATLLVAYVGPAASAYDHLLGVWPGPIYDEVVAVDRRLVMFRAGTLAWTGAALALGGVVARYRARLSAAFAVAIVVAAVAAALVARSAGGASPSRAEIDRVLGAVREGPRCIVHLAAERGPADAERALRDCEYDATAVAGVLGLSRPPRVTVWIYRSPEEKRRLVGAGHTSYTKPWLAEIHVHDQGVPHPLLRHELVHALGSAVAPGPLHVPVRAGFAVNAGLVEGLAVAVDLPSGDHGVHAWARALRDGGHLPPLGALLGATGFFGAAPARAYAASGSFLRFALEEHGARAVLAAYRDNDVPRALGKPIAELDSDWQRFLDRVVVPPNLAAAAEARFERGSLFARACPREVASLEHEGATASAHAQARRAESALRRASMLSGGDPAPLRGVSDAWRVAGDLARAEAAAREALTAAESTGERRALRGALLATLGDLRLRAGDAAAARAHYAEALALGADGSEARSLRARIAATGDARLRAAIAPWLLSVGDPAIALSRLAWSDAPLARYLLARARLARGAPALALSALESLDTNQLPDASFAAEARRMRSEALCKLGRWDDGIAAWRAIARGASGDGERERAADAASRCAFERDVYGAPVPWDADWEAPTGR